jgi:hypothetical protein
VWRATRSPKGVGWRRGRPLALRPETTGKLRFEQK